MCQNQEWAEPALDNEEKQTKFPVSCLEIS